MGKDKRQLHALDRLLDALEVLNLTDAPSLPPWLRERLEAEGIRPDPGATFTGLIEQVWALQEPYTARERIRAPTDDEPTEG